MYKVCADINDVEYRPVRLNADYDFTAQSLLEACDAKTKVIWLCSPNNPTGNDLNRDEIEKVLTEFDGIVVIDEAYSDFSQQQTFRTELHKWQNLIVLNTMSKAWGCAALRLGMAFASKEIIDIFNKVKYPYNINKLTQDTVLEALESTYNVQRWVSFLLEERQRVIDALALLPICVKIYPTASNFILVKVTDAQDIYNCLVEKGIIVRNRHRITLCENCLRITIGTRGENNELLGALRIYSHENAE